MNGRRGNSRRSQIGLMFLAGLAVWACTDDNNPTQNDRLDPSGLAALAELATSDGGVTPIVVAGNPACSDLNADNIKFPNITSSYGFKIESGFNGTYYFTNDDGVLTGGALEDATNFVTLVSDDGIYLDWTASLGIDAVIMKGGQDGNVYVYTPESFGDDGLSSPINPNNNQPYAISHVEFCYDYELNVEKTATAKYRRSYEWTIEKSVDPTSQYGFMGASFDFDYDVVITRVDVDDNFRVEGDITIDNPTPFEVSFEVEDYLDLATDVPVTTITCDPESTIPAGGTAVCSYSQAIGTMEDGTNVVTVTSLKEGVGGAEATAAFAFGDPTEIEGFEKVNVEDYYDGAETPDKTWASDPLGDGNKKTFEYIRTETCSNDAADYTDGKYTVQFPNTARIKETEQSDDAQTEITCYMVTAEKTAVATWEQTYDWEIEKSVVETSYTGFADDQFTPAYDVTVTQSILNDYSVAGAITISNPSPDDITVSNISDVVTVGSDDFTATISDCTFPLTVAGTSSEVCNYTAVLNSNTNGTNVATITFNGAELTATADVTFGPATIVNPDFETINVDDYFDGAATGEPLGSTSTTFTFEYDRDLFCPPTGDAEYVNGVYTKTFPNYAKIRDTDLQDDASTQITCYEPPSAKLIKSWDQGPEDIGAGPITFQLLFGSSDPNTAQLVDDFELIVDEFDYQSGNEFVFVDDIKEAGTWALIEVPAEGWLVTDVQGCEFNVSFPDDAGKTFECQIENTEQSRTRVIKTSNGAVGPQYDWVFAIFDGPNMGDGSEFLDDPLASSSTLGDLDGILEFGSYNLDPAGTYTICEMASIASAGWSSQWSFNGTFFPPYDPHQTDPEPQSLGYQCVDFGYGTAYPLTPGEFLDFAVENTRPGGRALTPGYWKNWSSCSNGGQYDKATGANDPDNEFWALDELLNDPGFLVGELALGPGQCEDAVNILDHREIDGRNRKRANDAAYDLARNLFAYFLNQAAGAYYSAEAEEAALLGQQLLVDLEFDGTGSYLRSRDPNYSVALGYSKILDDYNNNLYND